MSPREGAPGRRARAVARALALFCLFSPAACKDATEPEEPAVDPTLLLSRVEIAGDGHSAFPSATRLRNGDVLVTWRQGHSHVNPPARIMMARYRHVDGQMKRVETTMLYDSPQNEREAGLAELADGTLVANVFVSRPGYMEWLPYVVVLRSHDGGRTWTDTVTITGAQLRDASGRPFPWVASRSAVLELEAGQLLMPVYAPVGLDGNRSTHVLRSEDGGLTWSFGATIARDPGEEFNETSLLWVGGRVIAVFRSGDGYLRQAESGDDGRTWGRVRKLSIWGVPPHLLHLRAGQVLLARGYRREDMGVRYTLSRDGGRTWEKRVEGVLDAGSENDDCGYPSSVELDDGSIFTAYYMTREGRTTVHGAHFRIDSLRVP